MNIIFLIGRIIVGVYFLYNAFGHFAGLHSLSGYAQSKNVPAPTVAVLGSGLLLLIGGLSFITGYEPTIGVTAVVLFLLPVTFKMHAFWNIKDPMQKMGEQINFTKNLAIMGGALMFLAIPQPWVYSL